MSRHIPLLGVGATLTDEDSGTVYAHQRRAIAKAALAIDSRVGKSRAQEIAEAAVSAYLRTIIETEEPV